MQQIKKKSVSKTCAVFLAYMWEQGQCNYSNSLEPGSHMVAKNTAHLFETDINLVVPHETSIHTDFNQDNNETA